MPKLQLDDAEYHYEQLGKGPPLILIAGFASDAQSWGPVSALLAKEFTLLMPDNRGCGQTTSADEPISVEMMSNDISALMAAHSIERAQVLGHSMGGVIAQTFAAHNPDKVEKLVLCASALNPPPRTTSIIDTLVALRESGVDENLWYRSFFHWLFSPAFFERPAAVDAAIAMARAHPYKQSLADMRRQSTAIKLFDPNTLPEVVTPTLFLAGQDDLLTPPDVMALNATRAEHFSLTTIAGAAHSVHWDQPEAFCDAVFTFLKG